MIKSSATIVVKSAIPIGSLKDLMKNIDSQYLLTWYKRRTAINDNLYPSRIIVGKNSFINEIENFMCLKRYSLKDKTSIHIMSSDG